MAGHTTNEGAEVSRSVFLRTLVAVYLHNTAFDQRLQGKQSLCPRVPEKCVPDLKPKFAHLPVLEMVSVNVPDWQFYFFLDGSSRVTAECFPANQHSGHHKEHGASRFGKRLCVPICVL